MLADQHLLRIPGPSPVPPSVTRAMGKPMIGHRAKETKLLLQSIKPRLEPVFGTNQDVLIIAGSGTAGLEAAVVNTAKPGDEVLVIVTGAFGERFSKICREYNITVHQLEVKWGEAVEPEALKQALLKHPNVTVVFSTYCETSTGVLNPIDQLATVVHEQSDALIVVDGVSCVAGVETKMDEWDIDILVTGSQKAFMLPGGLTFIAASDRAWKVIEANEQPSFYLDLKKYRSSSEEDSTPFTPATSLLFGLEQVLNLFDEEGLEQVYARHNVMMNMTRVAFRAHGIPLLTSDQAASQTVTAVHPSDFSAEELRKVIKEEFGLSVAGGQQHLKGKIFRIGHMGYCSPSDVLLTIGIIELGLKKIGKDIDLGKGVRAAQEIYLQQGDLS